MTRAEEPRAQGSEGAEVMRGKTSAIGRLQTSSGVLYFLATAMSFDICTSRHEVESQAQGQLGRQVTSNQSLPGWIDLHKWAIIPIPYTYGCLSGLTRIAGGLVNLHQHVLQDVGIAAIQVSGDVGDIEKGCFDDPTGNQSVQLGECTQCAGVEIGYQLDTSCSIKAEEPKPEDGIVIIGMNRLVPGSRTFFNAE